MAAFGATLPLAQTAQRIGGQAHQLELIACRPQLCAGNLHFGFAAQQFCRANHVGSNQLTRPLYGALGQSRCGAGTHIGQLSRGQLGAGDARQGLACFDAIAGFGQHLGHTACHGRTDAGDPALVGFDATGNFLHRCDLGLRYRCGLEVGRHFGRDNHLHGVQLSLGICSSNRSSRLLVLAAAGQGQCCQPGQRQCQNQRGRTRSPGMMMRRHKANSKNAKTWS